MAYNLLSLVEILEQDQHKHHLSLAARSEINSFLEIARSLKDFVETTSFEMTEDLESRIRDGSHYAENSIESYIVKQLLKPLSEEEEDDDFFMNDLAYVMEEFESIKKGIIVKGQVDLPPKQSPHVVSSSLRVRSMYDPGVWGFNYDVLRLTSKLLNGKMSQLQVIPIVGIPGSGKTTLAQDLYYDSSIVSHVDIRAWVTISQEFNLREALLSLLNCLINVTNEIRQKTDDEQLGQYLKENLLKKRYLIVLDDIWHTNAWDTLKMFLPDDNNGSRIILTTRDWNLAEYAKTSFYPHEMLPVNENDSWSLFCEKVFGYKSFCPPELFEIGRKIMRNCRGNPLAIVTAAKFLSTSGCKQEVWQRVESEQLETPDVSEQFHSIKEDEMSNFQIDPSLKGFVEFFAKDGLQPTYQLMHGQPKLQIIPIVGLAESNGKTILAQLLYDRVSSRFDAHAWVKIEETQTMGRKQINVLATLQNLLDSLHKSVTPMANDDDDIVGSLHKALWKRRYLIVVDNIRDTQTWDAIRRFFVDEGNGSRVILTSKEWSDRKGINPFRLDSYWEFLLGRVPILLPTSESKLKFWELVAKEHVSSVDKNPDLNFDLVSMTYNNLPCHLKPCFLYVGAFPEDYEITSTQIIRLWIAEGFIQSTKEQSLEDTASMYLESLINRNLLFACRKDIDGKALIFKIHDVLWKFCQKKAIDEQFLWYKDLNDENIPEDIEIMRRVSVHPNCPPSDGDMSFVRSFLCIGPASLELAPMLSDLTLLRVLDILELQFDQFPEKLLQLVNLRYMALTCNSDLPSSISIFRNLQTLITSKVRSLPSELWELTKLRHIECVETWIWNVSGNGESILHEELQMVRGIPMSEVTLEFITHKPNLRKLGIIFYSSTDAFIPIVCLNNLEALECSYVGSQRRLDFLHCLRLPASLKELNLSSLKKLILSSCIIHSDKGTGGFKINHVGSLPLLERLLLQKCDFVGLEWEPATGGFTQLRYLLMEDLNLVHWRAKSTHFPNLQYLDLRACHAMKKIPTEIGDIPTLERIDVDEKCSPSLLTSAKKIESEQLNLGNDLLRVIFQDGLEHWKPSDSTTTPVESFSSTCECDLAMPKPQKSSREDLNHIECQSSTVMLTEEAEDKGYAALSTGKFVDAIRHYTDAINLSPFDHYLYTFRAEAYCSLNRMSEALLDAKNIVKVAPDMIIGYKLLGDYNLVLESYKDAVSAFRKGLEIDPRNDKLKLWLLYSEGMVAVSTGNFVEAVEHYTCGLDLDPSKHRLYSARAYAHAQLNQFVEALSDAQKVVQLKPDEGEGYISLGDSYMGLGNYNHAKSVFEKGLKIDPGNDILKARLFNAKGKAAFSTGNFVEAIEHYTQSLDLDPSDHFLYSSRSEAHVSLKQFSEALSDAQKTVELKPDWIGGYICLGNAYMSFRNYNCAISVFEKGLEIYPENDGLKLLLFDAKGMVACTTRNFVEGIHHFTDIINLCPSNHIAYCNRSLAHSRLKQFVEALSDAQKAVQLNPNWSRGYICLGDAYVGLHNYSDAAWAYLKALENGHPFNDELMRKLSSIPRY